MSLRGGWKLSKGLSLVRSLNYSFILIILILIFQVKAVIIDPDMQFVVGNETYQVNQAMDFSSITIGSDYIVFNSTGFFVTSGNDITITLAYLSDNIYGASDGDKVFEFYADTAGGNVWFNLSGFPAGIDYVVNRSGSAIATPTANSSGYISFENSVWSIQLFEIFQQGEGASDVILPEISDVSNTVSYPLDTDSGFGWENISCTVTDNVAVDQVFVNITSPDNTVTNFLMSNGSGSNYYYNTSFNQYGNYSYFIWANDTSDNTAVSGVYDLSLPPNWDINNDGVVNVFDHVLVSNHYSETGSFGWIREDVDNNGEIQVFDLVLVSNNYGEVWWEV